MSAAPAAQHVNGVATWLCSTWCDARFVFAGAQALLRQAILLHANADHGEQGPGVHTPICSLPSPCFCTSSSPSAPWLATTALGRISAGQHQPLNKGLQAGGRALSSTPGWRGTRLVSWCMRYNSNSRGTDARLQVHDAGGHSYQEHRQRHHRDAEPQPPLLWRQHCLHMQVTNR